ncbi:BgTH12-06719 [Blumeria graminis f. sp. triticale]|uniref:Polyprenal reductase n=1 Tax=Blumeria graminis f. sp. triticale TaxID=1689686 RepID=A0A9W4CYR4_BLUGR|nr:BgTH12-06719 [Blumeria graminis f. sp. triticale]
MDLALVCRVFFGAGAAVSLGGALNPSFRSRIMTYGSRSTKITSSPKKRKRLSPYGLFHEISILQVPHTWFIHYYIASVGSSIFWLHQMITRGVILRLITPISSSQDVLENRTQILLAWLLMFIQGTRRLYESVIFTKPTKSTMWFGLWIIGIIFYFFIGIAVWIEGFTQLDCTSWRNYCSAFSATSLKSITAILMFILASTVQHICHRHLAGLKKYSLPNHWLFDWIVCPHYASECFIYLAITFISAPSGLLFNRTVSMGLIFVVSNLAVTADSTKNWYAENFGKDSVQRKWRMVPFLY